MSYVQYDFQSSSLGLIGAGATERGLCWVALGEYEDALLADLKRRFPAEKLLRADRLDCLRELVRFVEQPYADVNLPLDIRGTTFQRSVWRTLQEIPFGRTSTYSDIAAKLGTPKAVRAVAAACGSNNIALVIPCHRVIGKNGKLSGFRWGVHRKAALLEREQRG